MSLINQMLKDLESRQNQKSTDKNSAISGLSPTRDKKQPAVSKKFLMLAIPAFLVLGYLAIDEWQTLLSRNADNPVTTPATQTAPAAAAVNTASAPVPGPVPASVPPVPAAVPPGNSQAVLSAIVNDSTAPSLQNTSPQATLPLRSIRRRLK